MTIIQDLIKQRELLFDQRDAMNEKIVALGEEIQKETAKELLGSNPTLQDVLPVCINSIESSAHYETRNRLLQDLCKKNDIEDALKFAGMYYESNQAVFQVRIHPRMDDKMMDRLATVMSEQIVPIIKPIKLNVRDEYGAVYKDDYTNNFKYIDIMEQSLSVNGAYALAIEPDDSKFYILLTRYGRIKVLHEFKTLKEALLRIKKDHHYGGSY